MTRDDLFKINAGIVKNLCEEIAKVCPEVRDRTHETPEIVHRPAQIFHSSAIAGTRIGHRMHIIPGIRSDCVRVTIPFSPMPIAASIRSA